MADSWMILDEEEEVVGKRKVVVVEVELVVRISLIDLKTKMPEY